MHENNNNDQSINFNVETTNGVVYLTGQVQTQNQADTAVKLAKSVPGVKSVNSKITVSTTGTSSGY